MEKQSFSTEQLVARWEDRRYIKNLMGKVCYCYLLKKEQDIFSMFWSGRADVCLGTNDGYYEGPRAVSAYYNAIYQRTLYTTEFIKKAYPKQTEKLSEKELFGVGMMDVKPMDTAVMELSEDGATAKGIWYSRGTYLDITTSGRLAFWSLACFAVDFVREDDVWKLWHMLFLEDINVPGGKSWGKKAIAAYPQIAEYAGVEPFVAPAPTTPVKLRERYTPSRAFSPLPEPPLPYFTFAETFSYGRQ